MAAVAIPAYFCIAGRQTAVLSVFLSETAQKQAGNQGFSFALFFILTLQNPSKSAKL